MSPGPARYFLGLEKARNPITCCIFRKLKDTKRNSEGPCAVLMAVFRLYTNPSPQNELPCLDQNVYFRSAYLRIRTELFLPFTQRQVWGTQECHMLFAYPIMLSCLWQTHIERWEQSLGSNHRGGHSALFRAHVAAMPSMGFEPAPIRSQAQRSNPLSHRATKSIWKDYYGKNNRKPNRKPHLRGAPCSLRGHGRATRDTVTVWDARW